MVGSGPHQAKSKGSQHQDHFLDLERKRDREGSVNTTHTSKSQSWGKSHVSREENARAMLKEIDHLKRSLRMNGESELHPIPTSLLMVKRMAAIGIGRGLLLASFSHMIRSIIMSAEKEIRPR